MILVMVMVSWSSAPAGRRVPGQRRNIGSSTLAVNLLTPMVIAAGTDYAIFRHRLLMGGARRL